MTSCVYMDWRDESGAGYVSVFSGEQLCFLGEPKSWGDCESPEVPPGEACAVSFRVKADCLMTVWGVSVRIPEWSPEVVDCRHYELGRDYPFRIEPAAPRYPSLRTLVTISRPNTCWPKEKK